VVGRPFEELPTCSKDQLTGWGTCPLQPKGVHIARYCATSGTTGPRLLVGYSAADWDRLGDVLGRRARMVGISEEDLLVNTHGYALWIGGPALEMMALGAGAGVLPIGPGSTDQLLRWLADLPITAISATPSYLRFLAARVDSTDDWQVRIALVGGEGASLPLRRQAASALASVRWQELYGSTEVGGPTLAWSPTDDPYDGRLLVDTDEFLVELLQPTLDEPVAPGEIGEVTVTTLHREGSPLVRYRTRDLAVARPGVEDPSGYPSMSTIIARVDDALKIRGALVYPGVVEALVVEQCPAGVEWRIVVDRRPGDLDSMTLVIEHPEPQAADTLAALAADRLGVRVDVYVVPPASLARFEGKASRVTDRRR